MQREGTARPAEQTPWREALSQAGVSAGAAQGCDQFAGAYHVFEIAALQSVTPNYLGLAKTRTLRHRSGYFAAIGKMVHNIRRLAHLFSCHNGTLPEIKLSSSPPSPAVKRQMMRRWTLHRKSQGPAAVTQSEAELAPRYGKVACCSQWALLHQGNSTLCR